MPEYGGGSSGPERRNGSNRYYDNGREERYERRRSPSPHRRARYEYDRFDEAAVERRRPRRYSFESNRRYAGNEYDRREPSENSGFSRPMNRKESVSSGVRGDDWPSVDGDAIPEIMKKKEELLPKAKTEENGRKWTCMMCTFQNAAAEPVCEMCNNYAPKIDVAPQV